MEITASPGPVQPGRRYLVPCIVFNEPQQPKIPLSRNGWPIRWLPILGPVHSDEGVAVPHVHLDTRFLDVDDPAVVAEVMIIDHRSRFTTKWLTAVRAEPFLWQREKSLNSADFYQCRVTGGLCPHRGIPLFAGARLADGSIECPGHGLRWQL